MTLFLRYSQVVGEKYIRLYDPIYSSRLYALGSTMLNNTSSVMRIDFDRCSNNESFAFRSMSKIQIMIAFHCLKTFPISNSFSNQVICFTCLLVIGIMFVLFHLVFLSISGGHKLENFYILLDEFY